MSLLFNAWMKAMQAEFEIELAQLLPDVNAAPQRLHEATHYAALDGGKRVRPLLVFGAGP